MDIGLPSLKSSSNRLSITIRVPGVSIMNFPSFLEDHLVARDDGTMELLLEMKPSCAFSDFVEALRSCSHHISSLHAHKQFFRDLTVDQETDLLNALHGLEEIHASFVSLPVRPLAHLLLRSSKHLQVLSLDRIVLLTEPSDSPIHSDAVFFSALQGLEVLQDFHFSLSVTATAPEGQKLFFQVDDGFDTLFQALSGIPTLRKIYASIGKNFASRSHMKPQTLRTLLNRSAVTDLTLVHFPLHREHCDAIASAETSLKSLSLVKARLGDEGAMVLAHGLARNKLSLQSLSLPGNKFTDLGGAEIVKALSSSEGCFQLQVLDLHGNQFTAAFGEHLADLLTSNSKIAFLDVSSNQLKDAGVEPIVMSLDKNYTLKHIYLYDTQLTDKSCEAFAGLLRVNTTLKSLNLYNNENISSRGIQVLAETLKEYNCDLERLEMSRGNGLEGDFGLDMYLRLNREYRRGQMLSSCETNELDYVNVIHKAVAKNDLNSIFFFLQAKPSLCC
jgi:Ran GTPase-activating protein (RanGAP) involved in mRNA processing and transport